MLLTCSLYNPRIVAYSKRETNMEKYIPIILFIIILLIVAGTFNSLQRTQKQTFIIVEAFADNLHKDDLQLAQAISEMNKLWVEQSVKQFEEIALMQTNMEGMATDIIQVKEDVIHLKTMEDVRKKEFEQFRLMFEELARRRRGSSAGDCALTENDTSGNSTVNEDESGDSRQIGSFRDPDDVHRIGRIPGRSRTNSATLGNGYRNAEIGNFEGDGMRVASIDGIDENEKEEELECRSPLVVRIIFYPFQKIWTLF